MAESLFERAVRRHREMCQLAVIAYNVEAQPGQWIARGLARLVKLIQRLEKEESKMGTKLKPGKFDCYANAAEDEPMFILLARDKHAPTLVWLWAAMRELDGETPEKIQEARDCIAAMIQYQIKNGNKGVGLAEAGLVAMMELIRAANHAATIKPEPEKQNDRFRLFLAQSRIEEPESQVCFWLRDDDSGAYDTECAQAFFFDSGGVRENDFTFCCFCGKPIQVTADENNED